MAAWFQGVWRRGGARILVVGLIGLYALPGETVENDRPAVAGRSVVADASEKHDDYRIREGAVLDAELGEFLEEGKRVRFYPHDAKTSFLALENVALERVARVLDENTSTRTWSVSGIVTEYRGGNYLLITRAVLKARGKPLADAARRD